MDTPNIDALAHNGMMFTRAYSAASVCSPSRAALVTGLYPARTGITNYLRAEASPSHNFLSTRFRTVPDFLGQRGYRTGLIGKWHLTETYSGTYRARPGNPYSHGFTDVICSEQRYIGGEDYFYPFRFLPQVRRRPGGDYLTDRLALEAADFVSRYRSTPFFLHLSNYAVHAEMAGRADLVRKYRARAGATEHRVALAATLESVDRQVGRVVAKLRSLGLLRNTLIFVTSDNGAAYREDASPLRGSKGSLYEGGIRVPLIAHWPGRIPAGTQNDTPVSTIDLLPTAVAAAGLPRQAGLDGTSLMPVLTGEAVTLGREVLFWFYPHLMGEGSPAAAARSGKYKLMMSLRDHSAELFDLEADPNETTDVSAEQPDIAAALKARLKAHAEEVRPYPAAPRSIGDATGSRPDIQVTFDESSLAEAGLHVVGYGASPVPSDIALVGGRLRVRSDTPAQVFVRSAISPSATGFEFVLDPGLFRDDPNDVPTGTTQPIPPAPTEEQPLPPPPPQEASVGERTVSFGLVADGQNYLMIRFRDDTQQLAYDICSGGHILTGGLDNTGKLDRTIDISAPESRLALTMRRGRGAVYVDEGRGKGWEFLVSLDVAGLIDLGNLAVRSRYRYAVGVRLEGGTVSIDGFTATPT